MSDQDERRRAFKDQFGIAVELLAPRDYSLWTGFNTAWKRNEQDRKDALRYRWLKDNALNSGDNFNVVAFDLLHAENTSDWDSKIDVAITKDRGQSE